MEEKSTVRNERQLFYEGKTQKREHQSRCSFFYAFPLLAISPIPQGGTWCASCAATWRKRKLKLSCLCTNYCLLCERTLLRTHFPLCKTFFRGPTGGGQNTTYVPEFVSWGAWCASCVATWWMCKLHLQVYIILFYVRHLILYFYLKC